MPDAPEAPVPTVVTWGFNWGLEPVFGFFNHSRVCNLAVFFDSPVLLTPDCLTISKVAPINVGGVEQADGVGEIPGTIDASVADDSFMVWVFRFTGVGVRSSSDGLFCFYDGVYKFSIDGSKVSLVGAPDVHATNYGDGLAVPNTFIAFFGDIDIPVFIQIGQNISYNAIITSNDNLDFRSAFNTGPERDGYTPCLDIDGNGIISSNENLAFRTNFGAGVISWSVTVP